MADVTLAECNGNAWLVSGEQYVGPLLFNSLPEGVTVELISCDSFEQVHRIWVQNCGESQASQPVLINPAIADRVRRSNPGRTIFFTQWSAMLDDDALAVLRAAANWMLGTPGLNAVLVEYVDPAGTPGLAELSRLRLTLIREKLVEFGVARERLGQQTRLPGGGGAASQQDSQRVDIEMAESRASDPGV